MNDKAVEFDPLTHQQDPTRALATLLRTRPVGGLVALPNGIVIRSIAIKHGSNMQRRFVVLPPEEKSTAKDRHRALHQGKSLYASAIEASRNALGTTEEGEQEDPWL